MAGAIEELSTSCQWVLRLPGAETGIASGRRLSSRADMNAMVPSIGDDDLPCLVVDRNPARAPKLQVPPERGLLQTGKHHCVSAQQHRRLPDCPHSTRRAFVGADASIGLQVLRTRREATGLAHWRGERGPQPQPQPQPQPNMQMMMRGAARARRAFAAYGLDPIAVHGEDLQPMLVVRHDDVLSMRIRLPRTVSPSHLKHRPGVHRTPMAPPDCACALQGCRAHRTPCGRHAARRRGFGPSFAANEQPGATV